VPCDCWDPLPANLFFAHCPYDSGYELLRELDDAEGARARLLTTGWRSVLQVDRRSFIGVCPAH
jgi:hypothetical protein